jgi:hypothetical protein
LGWGPESRALEGGRSPERVVDGGSRRWKKNSSGGLDTRSSVWISGQGGPVGVDAARGKVGWARGGWTTDVDGECSRRKTATGAVASPGGLADYLGLMSVVIKEDVEADRYPTLDSDGRA